MSALRTLRRRQERSHQGATPDGVLVQYRRPKPGSFNRRIIAEATGTFAERPGVLVTVRHHATKGFRYNREA